MGDRPRMIDIEIGYITQGLLMFSVNATIFLAVFTNKKLRKMKEYIPVAWLAFIEMIYACAFISGVKLPFIVRVAQSLEC